MELKIIDVVVLTGSPGLHRVIKSDDKAIVIESLDQRKKRQLIKGNMLVSKLADISIYTDEDSEPLIHILKSIKEKYDNELPVTKKSSKDELNSFLASVLPNFDRERVYPSNIKKILGWYSILGNYEVEFDSETNDEEEVATGSETKDE